MRLDSRYHAKEQNTNIRLRFFCGVASETDRETQTSRHGMNLQAQFELVAAQKESGKVAQKLPTRPAGQAA